MSLRIGLFALLLLTFFNGQAVQAQSYNSRVVVIGEDSDANAIPRNTEAYSRVVSVIQNQLSEAGYFVVDEQLLSERLGISYKTTRRRQDFVAPLQAANTTTDPLIRSRLAFVFSIIPIVQDMSVTRQIRVRVSGEIYDLATLRMLRSTEVVSKKATIVPLDEQLCNNVCVSEAIGEQARSIADHVAQELALKLSNIIQEDHLSNIVELSLNGFEKLATIKLVRALRATDEIKGLDLLSVDGSTRIYSVELTKDIAFLEEEVLISLADSGTDLESVTTNLSTSSLSIVLSAAKSEPLLLIVKNFSSSETRIITTSLINNFGASNVKLGIQGPTKRTFRVYSDGSTIELEQIASGIAEEIGAFETAITESSVTIEAIKSHLPTRVFDLGNRSDATVVQNALSRLNFYSGCLTVFGELDQK